MTRMRVAVVGAGIGGLAAANALGRKGINVTVYEQATQIGEVGAGVLLSRNSLQLLDRQGLAAPLRQVGTPINGIRLRDPAGAPIPTAPDGQSAETLAIYRPDVISVLNKGLPDVSIETAQRCTGFSQDNDHAALVFDSGEHAVVDVVIAADGVRSALQRHVGAPSDPVFSGSVAYRGLLPADRLPHHPRDVGTGWVGKSRSFLLYPPFHDGRLINWVGIVPSDDEMRESWSLPGDPAVLAAEFADWDPQLREIIAKIETAFRWGLYDRDPLPRWTNGRLALLGDAAHAMLPQVGQGANQAIEDGVALATLLGGLDSADAPDALLRYESLRRPRVAPLQAAGRAHRPFNGDGEPDDRAQPGAAFSREQSYYEYDVEADAQALKYTTPPDRQ